jgi:hypothetical protein
VVMVIQNPAYTGGQQNPNGSSIGDALNGIAGAFMNSGQQQLRAAALQEAQQKAAEFQQKQAAQGTVADAFTHLQDQTQDYAQDAPDYATPQPREFSLASPEAFNRAVVALGNPAEIGKALQLSSAITGGKSDPGVYAGSVPGGGEAQTFEGQQDANNLAIKKSAADAASTAAQKPYVYNDPVTGAPHVTNEAIAAGGQLPGGGLPQQSTDQEKAAQLNRLVFNPTPEAPAMTDNQQSVLGVDKQTPRPMTPEERTSYGLPANAPGFINEKGAPQTLGGNGTTVNVGEQPSFAKELGTERAKDVSGKMKAGEAAGPVIEGTNEAIGSLGRMIKSGTTTGVGAEGLMKIKSAANVAMNSLGLPPLAGDLSDPNVFTKATNGIAMNSLKQLVQGAGGRITNMEVQQFQKMNPGWDLSPEGNMRMLQLINQCDCAKGRQVQRSGGL